MIRLIHFPTSIHANPYGPLLYDALSPYGVEVVRGGDLTLRWLWRSRGEVEVIHFQWDTEDFYEARGGSGIWRHARSWVCLGRFAAYLAAARLLGYRLVWTMHEIYPHESLSRRLDHVAARVLARASHVLMAHDQATVDRARGALGPSVRRVEVVPHGSYVGVYPPGRTRDVVRAELEIPADAFVFICFGQLREYKQVDLLLAAFEQARCREAVLLVAGAPWERWIKEMLWAAAAADDRIRLRLEYVPDEAVGELFEASDAAVFSRGDGWTSGSLILALSNGVPAVAARLPAYEQLLQGGDAGWLFEPNSAESLARSLEQAASDPELARAKGQTAFQAAEQLRWNETAERTAGLLLPLVER